MDAEAERVHGSSTGTGTATVEEEEEDAIRSWEEERRASGILCLRRKSGQVESSRVGSGAVRCGTVRVEPNQSGQSPPFPVDETLSIGPSLVVGVLAGCC